MQESGETYLETILILSMDGPVSSLDVANRLGYSKPSVSRALHILEDGGYVAVARGSVALTEAGLEKASRIYERHRLLTRFLMDTLGLPESIAMPDACRIEHVISEESFSRIREKYTE